MREPYLGTGRYDRGLLLVRQGLHSWLGTSNNTTLVPYGYPIFKERHEVLKVRRLAAAKLLILSTEAEAEASLGPV